MAYLPPSRASAGSGLVRFSRQVQVLVAAELLVTAREGSEAVSTEATSSIGSTSCRCLLPGTFKSQRWTSSCLATCQFLLPDLPQQPLYLALSLIVDCDWHVARSPAFVGWATSRALLLATPATIP